MNKLLSLLLATGMTCALFSCTQAAEPVSVQLNGEALALEVSAQLVDRRVLVPLHTAFEELGVYVKWDEETKTASARKGNKTVTLTMDSPVLVLDKGKTDADGNPITEQLKLDVPAQLVSGEPFVPIRAVAECFNVEVDWDEKTQTVLLSADKKKDETWKENVGALDLSNQTYTGDGIEIKNERVYITQGGDFTLSGTFAGGVTVSTDEKVKLRLNGVSLSTTDEPCIYFEKADKAYITLTKDTENHLTSACDSAAVYSKENLEIKGSGTLTVKASVGHAIKASDDLTVEEGTLVLEAFKDGIHVNDTFRMTGGTVNIVSGGDGIDSESIVDIQGGTLDIQTTGEPVVSAQETTQNDQRFPMEQNTDVTFSSSSKGINAEWLVSIHGGEITVKAASHAIHCADEIMLTGGRLTLSSEYEKGISAHGNVTVSGADTVIEVLRSTEGLESKNILTINDGTISIIASDDAINATGGNSGDNMGFPGGGVGGPGGGMGGHGGRPEGRPRTENGEPGQNGRGEHPELRTPDEAPGEGGKRDDAKRRPEEAAWEDNGNLPPAFPEGERPEMPEMPEMPDNTTGEHTHAPGAMGHSPDGKSRFKDCLVINGGTLSLCAGDDCLDSTGNLIVNGGTVFATKSTGTVTGFESVLDPDGTITIGADAVLLLATGRADRPALSLTQKSLSVSLEKEHTAGDTIVLSDENGKELYTYTPPEGYRYVFVASPLFESGKTYTLTAGDEAHSASVDA